MPKKTQYSEINNVIRYKQLILIILAIFTDQYLTKKSWISEEIYESTLCAVDRDFSSKIDSNVVYTVDIIT